MMFFDIKRLIWMAKRRTSHLLARVDSKSHIHKASSLNYGGFIANSSVGRYSYVGPRTKLDNVEVGSFCSISWDCCIGLASHPTDYVSTSPIFSEKLNGTGASWIERDVERPAARRTVIGHDVWIGARALVLEGVHIGSGAVIAAGAIVTHDVAPYAIVAGTPAREIRKRFSEEVIAALLDTPWWEAPDADLRKSIGLFQSQNPSVADIARLSKELDGHRIGAQI